MRLAICTRLDAVGSSLDASGNVQLAADKTFGRYKKEDSYTVRQADVQEQTPLEQLRKRRDMLRSMNGEKAAHLIKFYKASTFFEALALAKKEGKIIVPTFVHDRILKETTDKNLARQYKQNIFTGTLIIYEAPDKPFGEQLVFKEITFKIPEQFRGLRNCALVVEHPDFELVDSGNNKFELELVDGASVHLIEQFPKKYGWHKYGKETGVPYGRKLEESLIPRRLWRENNPYICPMVCGFDGFHVRWRFGEYDWNHFEFVVLLF